MSFNQKLAKIESSIEAENRERAALAEHLRKLSVKLAYLKSRGIAGPRTTR